MTEKDNLKKILLKPQSAGWHIVSSEEIRKKDEDLQKKKIEMEAAKLDNAAKQKEIQLKEEICYWVKWVVSIYLAVVGFILFVLVFGEGKLESSVIIALLTTTTINILGLPWLIIRSLYPSKR